MSKYSMPFTVCVGKEGAGADAVSAETIAEAESKPYRCMYWVEVCWEGAMVYYAVWHEPWLWRGVGERMLRGEIAKLQIQK